MGPLVAYRLLCTAILATHCGLLSSDWVQNVALIVMDEFRVVMNISNVVAVDLMYSSLRTPCSLQSLARREVVTSLKDNPGRALDSIPVPPLIKTSCSSVILMSRRWSSSTRIPWTMSVTMMLYHVTMDLLIY